MSKTFLRDRTLRHLHRTMTQHDVFTPPCFAAYARAHVAWDGRIRPPRLDGCDPKVFHAITAAYTTADLRARGVAGWNNRAFRKRKR